MPARVSVWTHHTDVDGCHVVSSLVLTGTFNAGLRRPSLKHDVVDYCSRGKAGTEALLRTSERLQRAPRIKVMVVLAGCRSRVSTRDPREARRTTHRLAVPGAARRDAPRAVSRDTRLVYLV